MTKNRFAILELGYKDYSGFQDSFLVGYPLVDDSITTADLVELQVGLSGTLFLPGDVGLVDFPRMIFSERGFLDDVDHFYQHVLTIAEAEDIASYVDFINKPFEPIYEKLRLLSSSVERKSMLMKLGKTKILIEVTI